MKQEIEQIIRKNLPEERNGKLLEDKEWQPRVDDYQFGFNDCLSQINTSLIADEVLRVVVEKIQEDIKKIGDSDIKKVGRELWGVFDFSGIDNDRGERLHEIIGKMLISSHNSALNNLLSNLSPNKENKNNE